jgi:DNA-binding NarL/FixJ family response regulator
MFFQKKPEPIESLQDAEARFSRAGVLEGAAALRKKVSIVAIDDQNFTPEKNLINSGFSIEVRADIQRIPEVEPFAIVLCDVNGVGTNLSTETQGAYVIEEVKKAYPHKIVVAFSAGSKASKIVNSAKMHADADIRKDASIEEWRDLLDGIIRECSNPITVWRKERIRLLSEGIELQELLGIEQALIKSLGKGAKTVRGAIEERIGKDSAMPSAWKKEVGTFLASKAFDLAFEYVFKK